MLLRCCSCKAGRFVCRPPSRDSWPRGHFPAHHLLPPQESREPFSQGSSPALAKADASALRGSRGRRLLGLARVVDTPTTDSRPLSTRGQAAPPPPGGFRLKRTAQSSGSDPQLPERCLLGGWGRGTAGSQPRASPGPPSHLGSRPGTVQEGSHRRSHPTPRTQPHARKETEEYFNFFLKKKPLIIKRKKIKLAFNALNRKPSGIFLYIYNIYIIYIYIYIPYMHHAPGWGLRGPGLLPNPGRGSPWQDCPARQLEGRERIV